MGEPEPRSELFGEALDDNVETVSSVILVGVDSSSSSIEFDNNAKLFFCGEGVDFKIFRLAARAFRADIVMESLWSLGRLAGR